MEKVYSTPFRNYIQRNGFVMVSNLLLDFQQELGINEKELSFIIKVMKNRVGYAVSDYELDPTVCSKTLARRRAALKEKNLLNFSVIKKQNPTTGTYATIGISYDLSPLEAKLQEISDRIENKKNQKIEKEIVENDCLVESEENSPIEKFMNDWKEHYGQEYRITKDEFKLYNELGKFDKECVAEIFNYFNDEELFDEGYTPRLSFFLKTKFRFAHLKKYCENKTEETVDVDEYDEMLEELDEEKIKSYVDEEYFDHYDTLKQNKNYYKAIERLVRRHYKDGELPDIKILLDKAYENNLKYEFKKRS